MSYNQASARQVVRFVVLHHVGFGEAHFDLMVESLPGGNLLTWRCKSWPPTGGASAQRIGEHRSAYLEFEGALSDNRGSVSRVDSGNCTLLRAASGEPSIEIRPRGSPGFLLKSQQDPRPTDTDRPGTGQTAQASWQFVMLGA
jgi:hypothetical protein